MYIHKSCNYRDAYVYSGTRVTRKHISSIYVQKIVGNTNVSDTSCMHVVKWQYGKQSTLLMHICMSHVQKDVFICIGVAVHVNMLRNLRNVLVDNTTHSTLDFMFYTALILSLSRSLELPFCRLLALIFWSKATEQWAQNLRKHTFSHPWSVAPYTEPK